ncbi:DUF6348 family protein [Planotetraspora kaengkrachanensis]|uniref:Uncharacterized protein n=1 Tax=Planotetraspora kaengkrachanensis TaxID=575193 RepID=A0A8J3PVN8_9ACTN|nr:DUF6348 family protein [Planotetraspora kaengkrachanensis]GIG81946.1 hypothetical protein Pka01_50730 [Planotetraspora kaengkrachanensis]
MDDVRLPDEVVLDKLARRLSAATGDPWAARGSMIKGPGTLGIFLGEDHTGSAKHLDLNFVFNLDRPVETSISDCTTGFGSTVEEAVDRAIEMWLGTTGAALLELLRRDGSFAAHFPADDPDGFPGWHTIHGGISGWGAGEGHDVVQHWLIDNPLLPRLAPALHDALDRGSLIGVKVFFGGRAGRETAEVRVNGGVHEGASLALAGLDWPRKQDGLSYARTFMLLVHPQEPATAANA